MECNTDQQSHHVYEFSHESFELIILPNGCQLVFFSIHLEFLQNCYVTYFYNEY